MRIAVIQASTQVEKNQLLLEETKRAVVDKAGWEVLNFGVTANEENFSYIQISLCVGLLLNSGAIDFVVTGCSSGNGMAIAANALPNVTCGYLPTPADAFFFGRINQGNCASLPLGLNFGWAGEVNLRQTLEALFKEPMNTGYPAESAERKKQDAQNYKKIKKLAQNRTLPEILENLPSEFVLPIFAKQDLMTFLLQESKNVDLIQFLKTNYKHYDKA